MKRLSSPLVKFGLEIGVFIVFIILYLLTHYPLWSFLAVAFFVIINILDLILYMRKSKQK